MVPMRKIGTVVRTLRKQAGMSLEALANEIGYDQGNLSKLERGLQLTDDVKLNAIAKALSTSLAEMLRMAAALEESEQSSPVAQGNAIRYSENSSDRTLRVSQVPVFTEVQLRALAAGSSVVEAAENIPGYHLSQPGDFAVQVHDDSMTAAPGAAVSFPLGCFVYFERTSEHRSGDAVLVAVNDTVIFTTLQHISGVWMITPLNQRYTARELPYQAKVVGVAYGMMSLIRDR